MKTVKNPRSQQTSWDWEKEPGHEEDPFLRRIYVGGVPHDMLDQDLFHFFNLKFGPRSHVEHAVVLVKKMEEGEGHPIRTNRYGFVTFTSRETVKKVLAADISKLTLSSGRTLAVGPAKRSHLSYYTGQDRREEVRGAARLKVESKQEKSNLRVEAQDWRETRGYGETVSDTQSGQQEVSQGQVYYYNLQHQQYLQYQQHLHYQQYLQYPEVNMMYPQPGYSSTSQDQMLFYPAYYDQTGAMWTMYPLVYPPYQLHQSQSEYEHQPREPQQPQQPQYSKQNDLLQDSGFYGYDVSSTSIVTGEMSQTCQYENKEVAASPGNDFKKQPDSADFRRPGWKVESPYRKYKPFSMENNGLGQGKSGTNISKGANKKGVRADSKTDTDLGCVVKEPNNKGKEEMKEGRKILGKKKVIIDKSEKLEDPFKKLSI